MLDVERLNCRRSTSLALRQSHYREDDLERDAFIRFWLWEIHARGLRTSVDGNGTAVT